MKAFKKVAAIAMATVATVAAFGMAGCQLFAPQEKEDVVKLIDVKLTDEDYAFVTKKTNTSLI